MPGLADSRPAVSPLVTAALLLVARRYLGNLGLLRPTARQILEATGASHSRAYELKDEIVKILPDLERPVGRPRAEPPPQVDTSSITDGVLSFIMEHAGCVYTRIKRQRYSDAFRRFILELCELHREVPLQAFADAAHVPLGTLKDWLRGGQKDADLPVVAEPDPVTTGRVEMILDQWKQWKGSFHVFCEHISLNLRIPYGRTLIASILEQYGVRIPRRRPGRSPDEKALKDAFETFFPGAQWQGDGSPIPVQVGEQRFDFNLELMVDAHSDADVGISVRDEEDSQAVIDALNGGVETTGALPLAVLVDNRPSNHTEKVDEALGTTMRMRITQGRPQNNAYVEGAFGLFAQTVPAIIITATTPKEIARQVLELVAQTWARTLNNKPRKDRNGRSRAQIYTGETPTGEEVEQARADLEERRKKQELAQKTLRARQDPVVRGILDQAFARLGLADPQGNIRDAIARYPLDAIVDGIATFEGKRDARTLPDGVDGRYLLGIVRNMAQQNEGLQITEALLRGRLDARDRLLIPLSKDLNAILALITDPMECLKALIDRALQADRCIDRLFWLGALADHLQAQPPSRHAALLRFTSNRIHASFAVPHEERQAAVRFLVGKVIPLN